jgi:hypothetical protein
MSAVGFIVGWSSLAFGRSHSITETWSRPPYQGRFFPFQPVENSFVLQLVVRVAEHKRVLGPDKLLVESPADPENLRREREAERPCGVADVDGCAFPEHRVSGPEHIAEELLQALGAVVLDRERVLGLALIRNAVGMVGPQHPDRPLIAEEACDCFA